MAQTHAVHQRAHWSEWVAWPTWLIVCFLLAFIVGGTVYSIIGAVSPTTVTGGTFTDFAISTLVYAIIIALLLSIVRTQRITVLQRVSPAVRASVPAAIIAIATLLVLVGAMSVLLFILAVIAAGVLIVFSQLSPVKRTVTAEQLGVGRTITWSDIGLGIAGYVIYFVIFIVVTMIIMKLVPSYNSAQPQDLGFTTLTGMERVIGFLVLVVITPLSEELIMRGFLLGKLRAAQMPFWPAAIIVSLLFGLAHGQWNVGIDTFILSMVASYLRESTGTIWPGVVIHMAKNTVAYVALFILMLK